MDSCSSKLEGKCKTVPKHGMIHRVVAAVFGTAPGILIVVFSSQFFTAVAKVSAMVPTMFYCVCGAAVLVYASVIWQSAHVSDRAKLIDYLTQTAATFSTTVAALPFLKGVLSG